MKILVCCAGGMSSSLLVQKMREEAKKQGLTDFKIGACAINQLHQYEKEADVLLLAPQIDFLTSQISQENLQIIHITHDEYGTLNASSIIQRIIKGDTTIPKSSKETIAFSKLTQFFAPFASQISTNKTLSAISKSFVSIMPITIVGSLFTLLEYLPIKFLKEIFVSTGIYPLLSLASDATIDILSLYLVFFIAYNYMKLNDEHGHQAGLLAMICFFIITGKTDGMYQVDYLGTKGIFGAIFIGLIVGKMYLFLLRLNKLQFSTKIPRQVTRSLLSIVPYFIILSIFTIITTQISYTSYQNLHLLLYNTLQQTLANYLGNNIISYVFLQLIVNTLWFFGIHGGNVVNSITNPVYIPLAIENFELYSHGLEPIHIISNCFSKCFTFGGVGSMFSLSILMTFFAKSEQYKALGRISLPTTFFYINEPLLFGIPIIMNPLYFIPLMSTTPLLGSLTYFVMKIGLIPIPIGLQLPWTTPPIIYGLLQGGWPLALWEILMIVLAMLIWYPFFKIGDHEACLKEHNECHN